MWVNGPEMVFRHFLQFLILKLEQQRFYIHYYCYCCYCDTGLLFSGKKKKSQETDRLEQLS